MKKFLTCDINRRTDMSYGPCHGCSEGRAAQLGSHPVAGSGFSARGRRTPRPQLLHLQTPSLSLSRAGPATPPSASGRRCQSLFYGQAFAPLGGKTADVRHFHRRYLERDRQPSGAGGTESWGRPWLTIRRVGSERSIWNINLIGYARRNWRRLMNASCPTRSGTPSGPLPHRPKATRRF
jgi:hypothetical protein